MSTETIARELPVPADLESIRSVHDGNRWIHGILRGTVSVSDGVMTFNVMWSGAKRRITLATDIVGGYQCDA